MPMGKKRVEPEEQEEEYEEEEEEEEEEIKRNRRAAMAGTKARGAKWCESCGMTFGKANNQCSPGYV